jgi:hypothetical protein
LSIAADKPASAGEIVRLSFEVPGGAIAAQGVVRHSRAADGMGVEFTAMSEQGRTRLDHLLAKLLR